MNLSLVRQVFDPKYTSYRASEGQKSSHASVSLKADLRTLVLLKNRLLLE
jgi:hypothetical protein